MRYLNWLNFLILTLIIIVGVQIILKHVEAFFTVLPSEDRFMAYSRQNPQTETTSSNEDFSIIVDRNLFEVETGYAMQDSDIDPRELDQEFTDYKIANIGLTLLGTIYSISGKSKAIIKDDNSKIGNYYGLGDTVNGYEIVAIRRKKALVEKNQERYLLMQAKGLGETEEVDTDTGDAQVVSREEIAQKMKDFQSIWRDISVTPYVERGRITGARVNWIRNNSFFSGLGLQKNDVIKSLDGRKIKNYQEAMALYDSMSKRDRVRLEIIRNGQIMYKDFKIR